MAAWILPRISVRAIARPRKVDKGMEQNISGRLCILLQPTRMHPTDA
ncbi:hypothetical protein LC613_31760 [Nostoc sphaeroides CHAB 2801]|nr:hypothetical protein [Nostoc sphaeroides]MCC5632223.1 hypothetical protein [Nostoc sphaeroides CHAB 2801]